MVLKKQLLRRLAPVCLLCALLVMTTVTLAWMKTNESSQALYVALSDFAVDGQLYFGDQPNAQGDAILVEVSLDPAADNYIGKMKFQVSYTGVSPAYIRVRILEQWMDTTTQEVLSSNYLPYKITGVAENVLPPAGDTVLAGGTGPVKEALADGGVWIDERAQDFCYYYSVPVRPRILAAEQEAGTETLKKIQDGAILLTLLDQTAATAEENAAMLQGLDKNRVQLSLRFEVEAVQPNRFREFFGRETYPEPPAAP